MRRRFSTFLAPFIALPIALAGCAGREPAASASKAGPAPVAAAPATPAEPGSSPVSDSVAESDPSFETVLAPLHDVEIFARLDGEVMAIPVEEGQRVTAGGELARLDDRERHAVLEERDAEATRAESAWARAERLHSDKMISDEQFIDARSQWQIAKAKRDQAAIDYERCTVRAPFAGIVALRRVQLGQLVKQGDPMFRISNPDWLRAELLLPEAYLGQVRAGQPVSLIPVSGQGAVARVTRVNPLVDPASGTFRVVIDLDNRGSRLPGGVSVRVAFDPPLAARR